MNYKLRRILKHHVYTNKKKDLERHDIIFSNNNVILSEQDFLLLINLSKQNEHSYKHYDNIIYLDRHPSVIKDNFINKDLINEYNTGINNDNFYVSFFYTIIEE